MKRKTYDSRTGRANVDRKYHFLLTSPPSFQSQFNVEDHSDCQIVFKESGETLHLHKFILCSQSEYFSTCFSIGMKETVNNKILIGGDDEFLLTSLLKSLYTNSLTIPSKKDIVQMILIAEKYMLNRYATRLADCLAQNINQANVLQCLQIDLHKYSTVARSLKRYCHQRADKILEDARLVELDEIQMKYLLSIVVNEENGMKGISAVTNWVDFDPEERGVFTLTLTKVVQEAAKMAPVTHNQGASHQPLHWDSECDTESESEEVPIDDDF